MISLDAKMISLDGISIHVNRYFCTSAFVRWKRTHRRARIRKKWRKKYGSVMSPCPGHAYLVMGMGVMCCPCFYSKLKGEMVT